jgi:hypothetical protein
MAMIIQPMSDSDWHIEAIARDLAEQHPDVQRVREEMKKKVASAVNECKGECQRQNRSSADRYATPPINVQANPLGAKTGKKGTQ